MSVSLPPVVLSGSKTKAKAAVQLVNRSFRAASGPAVLRLYASTDDVINAADAPVGELRTKLKLGAGASKRLSVRLAAMPALPDGTYHLLAQLDRPDGGTDVVAAPGAFTVAAPSIVLRPTAARFTLPPTRSGPTRTMELTIENAGNVAARGQASVRVTAAIDGTPVLAETPVRLNLAPGKSQTLRVRVAVPPALQGSSFTALAGLSAGSIAGAVVPLDGASVVITDA
jgi:hypothetical protein